MGDELSETDLAADEMAVDAGDVEAESGDVFTEEFEADADAMAAWDAFEIEIADGLDAADTDKFLGRILGGLGRAESYSSCARRDP